MNVKKSNYFKLIYSCAIVFSFILIYNQVLSESNLSNLSTKATRDIDYKNKPYFKVLSTSDKVEDYNEHKQTDDNDPSKKFNNGLYYDMNNNLENDDEDTEVDLADSISESIKKSNQLVPPYAEVPLDFRRVCIYPNWSILRDSNMAKIYPEDIDPFLCTHIHYAYANIDVRNLQLSPSQYQDFNGGEHGGPLYERIMNLRQKNPNLKILISIGGWFAKSTPFNRILANANSRNTFIQNALNFIAHHKFDGIDLQWEYPGSIESGASADSKQKFTSLVKHMYKAFKEDYKSNYRRYFLSAFVPPDETRIDAGYQVKLICKYLDYLSVSTYDFAGSYDSKTGYNSPLYSRTEEQNSVNNSVKIWLDRGCPAKKLLIGVPTYAKAFKIVKKLNTNLVYLGIDSEPFVSPSLYTSEEGILSYYEVCEMMANKDSRVYWDDLAEVPFAIISHFNDTAKNSPNTQLWISYEDAKSARKKAEYVKKMNLGGVSIWSLDMDDFKGWFCNLGTFPIIGAIKEEFEHKIRPLENSDSADQINNDKTTTSNLASRLQSTTKTNGKGKSTIKQIDNSKNGYTVLTTPTTYKKMTTTLTNRPNNINKISNGVNTNREKTQEDDNGPKFKFKAVREIKLIACLDNKNKCNLKNDSFQTNINLIPLYTMFISLVIFNLF